MFGYSDMVKDKQHVNDRQVYTLNYYQLHYCYCPHFMALITCFYLSICNHLALKYPEIKQQCICKLTQVCLGHSGGEDSVYF